MPTRLALAALLLVPTLHAAVEQIWVEGETPLSGGEGLSVSHEYGSPDAALSQGKSLGGTSKAGVAIAYEVEAPSAGEYNAFVRRFWNHGPFRWRLGDGEWKDLREGKLIETTALNVHCISWLPLGPVTLAKGKQTLHIEALADGPFAIDCFAFVKGPFNPMGTLRAGEKFNKAEPGTWAFEPDADDFRADPLNLRGMNEPVAGSRGRIAIDATGDFVDAAGKPMRFWGGTSWVQRDDTASLVAHAKHLAKRGVNMVRTFQCLNPKGGNGHGATPDARDIDTAQKAVAYYKREGIYVTLSPYWAGFGDGAPQTTLFWSTSLQSDYKSWIKELLTKPNPYDDQQTPLGKDPALAIFQIQNEDSLFFWTTMAILKDEPLRVITAQYHEWRAKNQLAGTPELNFKFWELANPNQDHKDTMRFFAEQQRAWNVEVERFIREECGSTVLVNAGNWKTADQLRLLDLERWSYSGNAIIATNRYVNNIHVNPEDNSKTGYMVARGDLFTDESKLFDAEDLATNARQVAGKAYIIPESTWVPPRSYASEGPLLVAAYSALTGVDAYYWFSLGEVGYDRTVGKWQCATPSVMGGWPAASFLFRNGLVKRGAPVVHEERAMEDLWELRAPLLAEEAGYDPNRDTQISPRSNIKTTVDPNAYLVGPVEVVYGGDPAKSTVMDLKPFIDPEAGTVTANTREIVLNSKIGLCTVNAPAAQGATGFLAKAGTITLGALTIAAKNDYATVLAVALDSQPLASSKKVLLQITTQHRPYGWKQSPATFTHEKTEHQGFRIDSLGELPWNVVETDMVLSLANPGLSKVTRLDENLYPTAEVVEARRDGSALRIAPPRNAMYLLVE